MIPTDMPAYTAPTLVQVGNPLDLDYVLTDNTPFQPAETRIYRIRKSGMVLAEKSVSSLTGYSSLPSQIQSRKSNETDVQKNTSKIIISPNPPEEQATIVFSLSSPQRIRLVMTNVLGHTLQTIYEGQAREGESVFATLTSLLPSGVYWVRLFSENGVTTQPISVRK